MKKLWLAALGVMALIYLSTGIALAQSQEMAEVPFCGNLSESDCASLDATSAAMAGLTSASSESQIELYMTGGNLGDQRVSFSIASEFTFVIEPEELARLLELQEMAPEQLAAEPNTLTEALLLPSMIDTAQTTTIRLSPELLALLETNSDANLPAEFSIHVRMVNQVLYIRLADFAALGALPERTPEWIGIQTRVLLSNTIMTTVANPEINVEDIQDALRPPGAALAGNIIYHVPPDDLPAYADFMTLIALGSRELNGQPVNAYGLTWDVPRYVGGPLFARQNESPATSGFPSPASYLTGIFGAVLLDGLHAYMTQSTGVSDSYVYGVETQIEWAIGLPGGPLLAERPTLGFSYTMLNQDLNEVEAIPVPEGAVVVPLDTILAFARLVQK